MVNATRAQPVVSVVIPAFNAASTLPRAVSSLQAQTRENWECVIVDDGSTDGTEDVCRAIPDDRLRYFRLPDNGGRGVARQFALNKCRGDYLAMLDADDWYYPEKLELQLEALRADSRLGCVSTPMAISDDHGDLWGVSGGRLDSDCGLRVYQKRKALGSLPIPHASSLVRIDLARKSGYPSHLRRSEDFVFLSRVVNAAPFAILPAISYTYTKNRAIAAGHLRSLYRWGVMACLSLVPDYPLSSSYMVLRGIAKLAVARLAPAVARRAHIDSQVPRSPTQLEIDAHYSAAKTVNFDLLTESRGL